MKTTATSSRVFPQRMNTPQDNNNLLGYAHIAACSSIFFQVNRIKHAKTSVWCSNITIKDARVKKTKAEQHFKEGFITPSKACNTPYALIMSFLCPCLIRKKPPLHFTFYQILNPNRCNWLPLELSKNAFPHFFSHFLEAITLIFL